MRGAGTTWPGGAAVPAGPDGWAGVPGAAERGAIAPRPDGAPVALGRVVGLVLPGEVWASAGPTSMAGVSRMKSAQRTMALPGAQDAPTTEPASGR